MQEVGMRTKGVDGECGKELGIRGAKELTKAVECSGVEHSRVLTNGFVGDALLQSLEVSAQGRERQGIGGWGVACLDGLQADKGHEAAKEKQCCEECV